MTDCSTCKSAIRGETGIRCHGVCDKVYHSVKKCSGVDQYSIGMIDSNNFMRFICNDCMEYIKNVDLVLGQIQDGVRVNKQNLKEYKREFETSLRQNENEIKQLLEAIEKRYEERLKILDKTQKACEKNVDEIKQFFGTVKEQENKNIEMCNNIEKNNVKMCNEIKKVIKENNVNTSKMSFSDALKNKSVLPEVKNQVPLIIKPKEKQNIEKTKDDLNKKVDPVNFKITNVENRKNGTVIIQSENTSEREKIKSAIENKMSEGYEVKVPNKIEMSIVVTDMSFKYDDKEIIEKIKKQNQILENSAVELIKVFETKRLNKTIYNAKLLIDNETYPKVLAVQKINIGWEKCRVFDGTEVLQCFKCRGFNHRARECKNNEVCLKCHENHATKDCDKEYLNKCINCINSNKRLNLGLDVNHTTTSRDCPVYQNKLKLRKRTMGLVD